MGNAEVSCYANVYNNAYICGSAVVSGGAVVCGNADVSDTAKVSDARICGQAQICGDAVIESVSDYVVFKNQFTSGRYFTYTFSNKRWKVGCFYGNSEELLEKAKGESELHYQQYKIYADLIKRLEGLRDINS
jgi:hypothetical protein